MSYSRRQLYAMGEPLGEDATRREVGGKIIYGSGGGGGGNPEKQTTVVDIPDWAKPYAKESLGKAAALSATPYQTYGGERIAQFTPLQKQAFGRAEGQQVAGQVGFGTGLAGLAGISSFGDQGTAANFMSPYMDAVVQQQMDSAQRQADIASTQRGAQAVRAGAFGGSRQAVENAEAARALASQKGQIQATGLQSAFERAQSQFNQEQATRLNAAQTLGQLGQQQFGQQMDITGQQAQFGGQQRQATQDILGAQYQDFLNQQRAPYDQLAFMTSMIRGTPMGQTTTQYQPPPSTTSQLIGLGTAAAGAYGAYKGAAGGSVPSYAAGGIANLKNQPEMAAAARGMDDQQVAKTAGMEGIAGLTAGDEQRRRSELRMAAEGQKAPASMTKITSVLSQMSDAELQQYAKLNKSDPYTMALVVSEANRRKEGGMPTQKAPTVVDQQIAGMALPEDMGIAQLPVGEMEFAGGGIIAFQNRGEVPEPEEATSPFGDFFRGIAAYREAQRERSSRLGSLRDRQAAAQQGIFEALTPTQKAARAKELQIIEQEIAALQAEQSTAPAATPPAADPAKPAPEAGLGAIVEPDAAPQVAPSQQNMGAGPASTDGQGILSLLDRLGKTQKEAEDTATQYEREGLAAERAATEADVEKAKTFGSDREERLKKREEEAKGSAKQNVYMTMIDVGLRVAAGDSPNALSNIAKGAQQGLKGFQERLDTIKTNKEKLDEDYARLYEIREEKVDAVGARLRALNLQERSFEADAARRAAEIGAAIEGKKIDYRIGKEKSAEAFRNAQAGSQTPERQAYADLLAKNKGDAVAALTEFNQKFGKKEPDTYAKIGLESLARKKAEILASAVPESMKAPQIAALDAEVERLLGNRATPAGGAFTVTAGGRTYNFPTQEAANKFKAEAGVK